MNFHFFGELVFQIITVMSSPNLISALITLTSASIGFDPHYFSSSVNQSLLV